MHSREVIKRLLADGWVEIKTSGGSHRQFKHPTKTGKVTVKHPARDFPIKTLRSMEKQSGLKFT